MPFPHSAQSPDTGDPERSGTEWIADRDQVLPGKSNPAPAAATADVIWKANLLAGQTESNFWSRATAAARLRQICWDNGQTRDLIRRAQGWNGEGPGWHACPNDWPHIKPLCAEWHIPIYTQPVYISCKIYRYFPRNINRICNIDNLMCLICVNKFPPAPGVESRSRFPAGCGWKFNLHPPGVEGWRQVHFREHVSQPVV